MVNTLMTAPPTERVTRSPKHTFRVNSQPFTLQPHFIAPVLPGETVTNLFMESRVVTDPVLSPIIGWKKEYYYFYVPVSILGVDAFKELFVDPTNASLSGTYGVGANVQWTYTAKGGIDWVERCHDVVAKGWFRDDGETVSDHEISGGPAFVQIRENTWMDSITDSNDMPEGAAISGATDAGDLDRLMDAFDMLRAMGLSNMTYEDFLRSQGIHIPEKDGLRPELLCRFSDFQYPANTINPSTGAPSSAVSWVFKNGERKPWFCKEPGFIVGYTITRPKIYFGGLAGGLVSHMDRAWDWLVYYMAQTPETSLKEFAADTGPLGDRTSAKAAYFVDMRDLLTHGDQFQNVTAFNPAPANVGAQNLLALPPNDLTADSWKYPDATMAKSFFVDAAGTAFYVKEDGYVSLSVKGKQIDYTTGSLARA